MDHKEKSTGMNTWTEEGMFVMSERNQAALRQGNHPNKGFLGSKDQNLVRLHRHCLGFTKIGKKARGDSSTENKYDSKAFLLAKEKLTNVKIHLSEASSRLDVEGAKHCRDICILIQVLKLFTAALRY